MFFKCVWITTVGFSEIWILNGIKLHTDFKCVWITAVGFGSAFVV